MLIKKPCKADVLTALIPSLFLSFTFFIFGPVEIYITNITELWFPFVNVLLPSVLAGIIACALFFLIGLLLRGKWREWYGCLLTGIGLALYIQGNFVQTDYGVLDGQAIQWENYTSIAILDTLLWFGCIAFPFIARLLLKKQYKTGAIIVTCCLMLVQVITLSTLAVTTDFTKYENSESYLSTRNLYTVSSNQNVVVFVLDTFDQTYLEEIISEDPDILTPLDGFTYYTNATCAYPTTKGSLPYILTGQHYKNEQPYGDYIVEAYRNTDYYETLYAAGYDIGLYTSNLFVSDKAKEGYVGNAESGAVSVGSTMGLEMAMLRFTAFRYFPHIAKQSVWFYSGIFDQFKQTEQTMSPAFSTDNLIFYTQLTQDGLELTSRGNAYRLIHLWGTHAPYSLNSDVTTAAEGQATAITQGKACLNILYEYLEQLKKLGAYDNTLIIITADHGKTGCINTRPILLVKNFGETGELKVSCAPVSHTNLIPTVMTALGLNTDGIYGRSVNDVSEQDTANRTYYWYAWDGSWDKDYLPDMTEREITPQNVFIDTGKKYTSNGMATFTPYAYDVGNQIIFTEDNDGSQYFISGISEIETDFAWSSGTSGQIVLDIGDVAGDLVGEFQFAGIYAPPQRLIVRCGNQMLYDAVITSAEKPVIFLVPAECVMDGRLILDLEYPNAVSPYSRGEVADFRDLAFRFSSIRFLDAETYRAPYVYDIGSQIVFYEDNDGRNYFRSGISNIETDSAWSLGTSGQILLSVGDVTDDLIGEFQFKSVYAPPQRFVVRCGDQTLYDAEVTAVDEPVTFTIPAECIQDGRLALDLEYPNAVSPESRGENTDARELALRFLSIRFYEAGA